MKRLTILMGWLAMAFAGTSQAPLADYSFDGCDASSANGLFDGSITGMPDCVCGLSGQALAFDAPGEAVFFSPALESVFKGDFTLDFYFTLDNVQGITDILSYRNQCNTDSLLSLKYFPANNTLLLELAKNIGDYQSVSTPLPDGCWHRFTLVRKALTYTYYLNNQVVEVLLPNEEIPMSKLATMAISGSPCQAGSDVHFNGKIDEFKVYDRALSDADLRLNYLYPDQLVNRDTTIFLGGSVQLLFGASCHNLNGWTPATDLDDPTSLNPIASPQQTTTYRIMTSDADCTAESEITIYVVDSDDFDCQNLLLPTAFTPNGDLLNDEFGISNTFIVESIEVFYILDQWGNTVFKTASKNEKWDGTYDGKKLGPGTYTWIINYRCGGQAYTKVGSVMLLV